MGDAGLGSPHDPLALLERAAIAEEVASSLRHDLRNKLGSIRNAAFFLSRRSQATDLWASDPKIERFFGVIDQAVEEANQLLTGRFSLADLFARHVERVPLRACVERAVGSARVLPTVTVELAALPGEIEIDPTELALALRCLIENAAEAMDQRGVVRIEGADEGDSLAITVRDSGPGVGEAEREDAFLPLRSTKQGHAGLGLNIARRIARRYGGELELRDPPASGGAVVVLTCKRSRPKPNVEGGG